MALRSETMKALEDRVIEGLEQPPETSGKARVEPSPRWVRAVFASTVVADSRRVMLLYEPMRLPVYYFPVDDVRMDLLTATDHRTQSPSMGEASYWSLRAGDRVAENAAWSYQQPRPDHPDLSGYIAFYWNAMDAWYEEDDEVFIHPRDPHHRVDVLNSSRHVQVVVLGETVADTRRPRLLFETGLPTRYYIPKWDVRMDLLVPSETTTACPYKGRAMYWSVKAGDAIAEDVVWSYPFPIPECPKIENLMAFYNEHVDAIYVDDELVPVPKTPWSK
jgi:uncharacterized protein (DUF427 family)